jgi:hypothetical protein
METLITEVLKSEIATYVTATCDKTTATVVIDKPAAAYPRVQVICQNASHRVWRRSGRFFANTEEALNGYKSGAMKAIIMAAAGAALAS